MRHDPASVRGLALACLGAVISVAAVAPACAQSIQLELNRGPGALNSGPASPDYQALRSRQSRELYQLEQQINRQSERDAVRSDQNRQQAVPRFRGSCEAQAVGPRIVQVCRR